jgi:hypothetical protein
VVPVELPVFESCQVELPFPPRFHPLATALPGQVIFLMELHGSSIETAPFTIVTKAKDSPLIAGVPIFRTVYVHCDHNAKQSDQESAGKAQI